MQHVELIGVAGSGKSTLASMLHRRRDDLFPLGDAHRRVVLGQLAPERFRGPLATLLPARASSYLARTTGMTDHGVNLFAVKYPGSLDRIAKFTRKYSGSDQRVDFVAGKVLGLIEQFGTIEAYGDLDGTLVIDEGFASGVASIVHPPAVGGVPEESDIAALIEATPTPDLILFASATPRTCASRLQSRPGGPPPSWEPLPPDRFVSIAADAITVAERIAAIYRERGVRVVEIDTEFADIGDSVAAASRAIPSQRT